MKKKILKTTLAVVCVSVSGTGSWKAYSTYEMNKAGANLLLTDNIEALSNEEDNREFIVKKCFINEDEKGKENSIVCPEGTESHKVYDCNNDIKKVNPYSASAFCVQENKN